MDNSNTMIKYMKILGLITFVVIPLLSLTQEHLKHEQWNTLLQKYVDDKGHVNYKGFKKDEIQLDKYLTVLSQNHPNKNWKEKDRMAFWINTYNAFTVKLIVKNYPVKSIKELGGSIYKVNTPWDIKFITIGSETYDLNNIEHSKLRKQFNDPRIHFAVNCASVSCPRLRNEAYVGEKLDKQLDDQADYFINHSGKNKISKGKAELSKIFNWYSGDFKQDGETFISFINKYAENKITDENQIIFLDYNWNLNE